jgi:DNA-binding transcriptional ArsR family regulator
MGRFVEKSNSGTMEENVNLMDINAKLELMHQDIKRIKEKSNQEYLEFMLSNIRTDFSNSLATNIIENIDIDLEKGIIKDCHLKNTCRPLFKKFLKKNIELIKDGKVPEDSLEKSRYKLKKIRANAPLDICDECHDELSSLFEKQVNLMQSLQIYRSNNTQKQELSPLSEDLVKEVLEPLANNLRLQILQALASETKTYSELSKLTGMRGGNLLFHIQKLQNNDFILQRNERGDYMITKKGFNLLLILNNVQEILQNDK